MKDNEANKVTFDPVVFVATHHPLLCSPTHEVTMVTSESSMY